MRFQPDRQPSRRGAPSIRIGGAWLLVGVLIGLLCGSPIGVSAQATPIPSPPAGGQLASPAFGQAQATPIPPPVSADVVNAIAHNLYCPVCANTPLDVCPTEACIRWRAQIADLIGQGDSEAQIRQYFIDHFGMRTVAIPTDSTSRLLVLGLPYALIAVALLLILWQLWRWRRGRSATVGSAVDLPGLSDPQHDPPTDPADGSLEEYRARFEEALKEDR